MTLQCMMMPPERCFSLKWKKTVNAMLVFETAHAASPFKMKMKECILNDKSQ